MILSAIFKALDTVADKIWPDAGEKEANLAKIKSQLIEQEATIIKESASVIRAEVSGDSWLQKSWRPITMIWFLVLISAYWFGFTPPNMPIQIVDSLFSLVQLGLGGYVIGRSAEKITEVATGNSIIEQVGKAFRRG